MLAWLQSHMELIAGLAYVGINILNGITAHYSEKKGLVKVCLMITEVLSIITSYGVPGKFKLPIMSVAQKPVDTKEA